MDEGQKSCPEREHASFEDTYGSPTARALDFSSFEGCIEGLVISRSPPPELQKASLLQSPTNTRIFKFIDWELFLRSQKIGVIEDPR